MPIIYFSVKAAIEFDETNIERRTSCSYLIRQRYPILSVTCQPDTDDDVSMVMHRCKSAAQLQTSKDPHNFIHKVFIFVTYSRRT